jgi:hypothetical protein
MRKRSRASAGSDAGRGWERFEIETREQMMQPAHPDSSADVHRLGGQVHDVALREPEVAHAGLETLEIRHGDTELDLDR